MADGAFKRLLRRAGVPEWKFKAMYAAVRVFGHVFYAARARNNRVSTKVYREIGRLFFGVRV